MPYRDERKALEDRRTELTRSLAGLERDTTQLRGAVLEADRLRRELADIDDRLAKSNGERVLPTLDDLRVASPCNEAWDAMDGDDRVRFCGSCKKNVYNLSSMTRDEAKALLAESEGRVCVRFYRRADGTVLTSDCPVGQKKKRRRLAIYAAGATAVATAAVALVGGSRGPLGLHVFEPKPTHAMGAVPITGGVEPPWQHVLGEPVLGHVAPPVHDHNHGGPLHDPRRR